MRAAVLFSGLGGWEIAAALNGVETVWAAEWDDWKRERYLERWPSATLYRDVENLDGSRLVRDHGCPDIVLASPPCTDISAANVNGAGIDGDESRHYLTAVRLARALGTRWVGFENSPRLRTRGADRVLAELEASGYTCWANVVEAEDAGAPHERGRSFVLGCRADVLAGSHAERDRLWQQQGWSGWPHRPGAAEPQGHDRDPARQRSIQKLEFVGAERAQQAKSRGSNQAHADPDLDGQLDRAEYAEMGRRARADGAAGIGNGKTADLHRQLRRHRAGRDDGTEIDDGARPTPGHSASRARSEWPGVGRDDGKKLTALERAALCPWDQRGDGLAGYLSMAHGVASRLRGHGLSERAVKAELARWRSALGDALVVPVVWAVVRAIVRTDAELRQPI